MVAAKKAAQFKPAELMIVGPVLCIISAVAKFLVCDDKTKNMSLRDKPTVMKGKTCVLSRFIGKPIRLQTPKAAAEDADNITTPSPAKLECTIQPYITPTARTTPILIISVLECSLRILFRFAVEKEVNE